MSNSCSCTSPSSSSSSSSRELYSLFLYSSHTSVSFWGVSFEWSWLQWHCSRSWKQFMQYSSSSVFTARRRASSSMAFDSIQWTSTLEATTAVDFGDGDLLVTLALCRSAITLRAQTTQQLVCCSVGDVPRYDGGKWVVHVFILRVINGIDIMLSLMLSKDGTLLRKSSWTQQCPFSNVHVLYHQASISGW